MLLPSSADFSNSPSKLGAHLSVRTLAFGNTAKRFLAMLAVLVKTLLIGFLLRASIALLLHSASKL